MNWVSSFTSPCLPLKNSISTKFRFQSPEHAIFCYLVGTIGSMREGEGDYNSDATQKALAVGLR